MKRTAPLLVVIAAAAFVIRRLGRSISLGAAVLGDAELTQIAGRPLDLIVFGMVDFPSGTSPELASAAVKRLRVFGLAQAEPDMLRALSGRIKITGAMHSVD